MPMCVDGHNPGSSGSFCAAARGVNTMKGRKRWSRSLPSAGLAWHSHPGKLVRGR